MMQRNRVKIRTLPTPNFTPAVFSYSSLRMQDNMTQRTETRGTSTVKQSMISFLPLAFSHTSKCTQRLPSVPGASGHIIFDYKTSNKDLKGLGVRGRQKTKEVKIKSVAKVVKMKGLGERKFLA